MDTASKPKVSLHSISALVSNTSDLQNREENKKRSDCYCSDIIPKRYLFTFVGCISVILAWMLSTNLNFAIVYMVDRTNLTVTRSQPSNECLANILPSGQEEKKSTALKGELYWSPETEGLAIAAVYYGQMFGYVPGGRLAEIYGGKRVLMTTIFLASVFTSLLPVAARYSVYIFIILRFLIGALRAAVLPTFYYLISRWTPHSERNFTCSLIFAGYGLGAFVSFLVSGKLCASTFLGGWPSIFYVFAVCGLAVCVICYIFLYDAPDEHPTITEKELEYISLNIGATKPKQIKRILWKSMMSSIPLWSLLVGTFGQFWISSMFIVGQPLYMGTILNLDSSMNGYLSSLPHLVRAILSCSCGYPLDWAVKKGYISTKFVRKGSTIVNSACCCIGIVGILLSGCSPTSNGLFFNVSAMASTFIVFGVGMNFVDIAPNLSGTVSGIASTFSICPFLIAPALIGWLTKYERSMAQWRYFFYCTIGIVVTTTMVFVIFGSTDPQPWGSEDKEKSEDGNTDQTRL